MDSVRHLLDMSVQFVVGSLCRLPSQRAKDFYGWDELPTEVGSSLKLCDVYIGDVFIAQGAASTTLGAKEAAARQVKKDFSTLILSNVIAAAIYLRDYTRID